MDGGTGTSTLRRLVVLVLAMLVALTLVACVTGTSSEEEPIEVTEVILASTTSTQDSGLFDVLEPAFEEAYPQYDIKIVAVGTGEALALGENKDADVLLVHAKASEEEFVAGGFGIERLDVMYNDFVIVGPADDPAEIGDAADLPATMQAIADAGAAGTAGWVSRGDDSGTHKKELQLWEAAQIAEPTPAANDWYESSGQGMGETLRIASEQQAYTLSDRATYLTQQDTLDLVISREGDVELLNEYGVIVVTDAKSQEGGQAFADWLLSEEGQQVVGEYGVDTFGEPLFTPNAK